MAMLHIFNYKILTNSFSLHISNSLDFDVNIIKSNLYVYVYDIMSLNFKANRATNCIHLLFGQLTYLYIYIYIE